jgi:hypothetical protein
MQQSDLSNAVIDVISTKMFFFVKAWFHERFFLTKCEIFRLFLLNCEQSSRNNLFEWSQFKRNRRNISHFAKKKRSWNQTFSGEWLVYASLSPFKRKKTRFVFHHNMHNLCNLYTIVYKHVTVLIQIFSNPSVIKPFACFKSENIHCITRTFSYYSSNSRERPNK